MSHTVEFAECAKQIASAARWLREHLELPVQESLIPHFEHYFNVTVIMYPDDTISRGQWVTFHNEQEYVYFLLRWSNDT